MNIDIKVNDGSPTKICPECLYGDSYRYGVGGSEYYLLTLCEAWGSKGYKVRLYNDPHENYKQVDWMEQLPIESFNPDDDRDIFINFRSPSINATRSKGRKIWLSCDQYSTGDYRRFAPHMDKIVCISQHHLDFFKKVYGIENAVAIDIPVRENDFIDSEKIRNRLIFTSIPDRGLRNLLAIYPTLLKEIPDISLVITSDYRLWAASAQNEQYRIEWIKYMDTVQFRGALPRMKYMQELSKASLMVYPCNYAELFCISVSEAQSEGVYTITSTAGALPTTNMGMLIGGNPDTPEGRRLFIDKTIEICNNQDMLKTLQDDVRSKARERFSLQRILQEWEKVFNE
jgi:glycosyltransferase involved in cell wall biosynthesis